MTKNLSTNVQNADSGSMHRFSYRWKLTDLEKVPKNGLKVFSCFSCGGGSSMGYKLAGYEVIGNCEIDPVINEIYVENNHPKHNYMMDIRKFIEIQDLPDELMDLDILDGSPPCSTFSTAGDREKSWGKEKVFKEGQAKQTLDDLFFWYIKAIDKLKPKVFIAENVKGLLIGNAKGYVNQIVKEMDKIGYTVQIFLLNAATMGVPQKRKRVFFIGHRKDIDFPKLDLSFNEKPIRYGEFMDDDYIPLNKGTLAYDRFKKRTVEDKCLGDTVERTENGKISGYTHRYLKSVDVAYTLTAGVRPYRFDVPGLVSDRDIVHMQSFPEDYDFLGQDPCYVCGMSVPPVMMANISAEICRQWFERC